MSWTFDLCGDHLALDFTNTLGERETDHPVEHLEGYADLVSFAWQSGVVYAPRADALLRLGSRHPIRAGRVLARALILREALYRLFRAVALAEDVDPQDVDCLNAELGRLQVGLNLSLSWQDDPEALDPFMGAIVLAALRLATQAQERARVRVCEAPDCEWLFYDGSRNRSRRWCDMRQCGNRMKARRHHRRSRSAAP